MVNLDSLFMNDLVSIIVPVYNSSPYLKDMLCCIVSQTYQNRSLYIDLDKKLFAPNKNFQLNYYNQKK